MLKLYAGIVLLGILGCAVSAAPYLVIYPQGLALVEETRTFDIASQGAITIDRLPDGFILNSLTIGGLTVLSVTPSFPSPTGLNGWDGMNVEVISSAGTFHGRVIRFEGDGLFLATGNGTVFIRDFSAIRAPYPYLKSAEVRYLSEATGSEDVLLRYLTRGISWEASYRAELGDGSLDLTGTAILTNDTGISFLGAEIGLIAGEINAPKAADFEVRAMAAAAPEAAVSQASEYHRYSLPRPVDLAPGTTLIPLLSATLPYERIYRFRGRAVETVIRFENTSAPLPAGEVSVYEEEGRLLIGSSSIGHTPIGEEVELTVGAAFDLTGERVQISHLRLGEELNRDSYRITIRSAKDELVEVEVLESLYGTWTITESSLPYEAVDSRTVRFDLPVPAGGEAEVTYTVEWSYQ